MELLLRRKWFTQNSTIGELYIDDKFECYILEDVARALGVKIKGQTAIPEGDYQVIVTFSNRFNKDLPLLVNAPNSTVSDNHGAVWSGIRIHSGNDSQDTEGCLLTGTQRITDKVINSRIAFSKLMEKIDGYFKNSMIPINMKIINDQIR